MAALFRFSEDVSEEELTLLFKKQFVIPIKTKMARKYGLKNLKGKKKII